MILCVVAGLFGSSRPMMATSANAIALSVMALVMLRATIGSEQHRVANLAMMVTCDAGRAWHGAQAAS